MTKLPHLLILGAGFAGLGAAVKLKKADVAITLVDQNDYHTFQPLLYQVANSILEPSTVGEPIENIINGQKNLTFKQVPVTHIDLQERRVQLADMKPLTYDYLVLALGANVNYFGVLGAAEHAFPLYTLADAIQLRNHILQQFDLVDKDPSQIEEGVLNFVILGGGPTGVETAGALAEFIFHDISNKYPHVPVDKAQVILVEGSTSLLKMFKPDLQHYTKGALQEHGVTVHFGQRVTQVAPHHVTLNSGDMIKTRTLVWAAGLQANPLVKNLGLELGPGGRIPVGAGLTLEAYPEVYVAGDIAFIRDDKAPDPLPQLGSVAIQSGEHIADNIKRLLKGKPAKPFKYLDKGTMATISRGAAVLQMPRGRSMIGKKAFLAWGTVHLALLPDGHSRRSALSQWSKTFFTHDRLANLDLEDGVDI